MATESASSLCKEAAGRSAGRGVVDFEGNGGGSDRSPVFDIMAWLGGTVPVCTGKMTAGVLAWFKSKMRDRVRCNLFM